MAEAPGTPTDDNLNAQLTRTLSNMLYEDQLNMLMKKYEEIEDKSHLLPDVEKAMQACLAIQELLQGESGENSDQLMPSDKAQDLKEQHVKWFFSYIHFKSDANIEADAPESGGQGHKEVDMRSDQVAALEEINPSSLWSSSALSRDMGNGRSSLGFESSRSLEVEKADPRDKNWIERTAPPRRPGMSKKVSIASLEAVNPSLESEFQSGDQRSMESDRSKKASIVSLEVMNPSSDFKSRDFQSEDQQSMEPGSSHESGDSMDVDDECLQVANPSFESVLDESVPLRDDLPVLISRSKFSVTLKPSTLKADAFSPVDVLCSTSVHCVHFNNNTCHYTVPVEGNYQFIVRKIGHQNVQCRLRKGGGDGNSKGKACEANSRWRRGNLKLVVNWPCSVGQVVWVEGKGQTNDCGMAVVFSGSLLED